MSEVFDSKKGIAFYEKRTICDMHRDLYDYIVVGLKDDPEKRDGAISILEEAYDVGIKMTLKLVENKLSLPQWKDNIITPEKVRLRILRTKLTNMLTKKGKPQLCFSSKVFNDGTVDRSWYMKEKFNKIIAKELRKLW